MEVCRHPTELQVRALADETSLHLVPLPKIYRMYGHQSQARSTHHIPLGKWLKSALRLNRGLRS